VGFPETAKRFGKRAKTAEKGRTAARRPAREPAVPAYVRKRRSLPRTMDVGRSRRKTRGARSHGGPPGVSGRSTSVPRRPAPRLPRVRDRPLRPTRRSRLRESCRGSCPATTAGPGRRGSSTRRRACHRPRTSPFFVFDSAGTGALDPETVDANDGSPSRRPNQGSISCASAACLRACAHSERGSSPLRSSDCSRLDDVLQSKRR
jgi:hypothetical protein